MKKSLLIASMLTLAVGAFAQGTVTFNNFVSGVLRAPIYAPEPGNPALEIHGQGPAPSIPAGGTVYTGAALAGTGFTVTLWGHVGSGVAPEALTQLASATFRTGTGAGLVNTLSLPGGNSLIMVPNAPIDGTGYQGTFALRAWDNQGGTITTWAAAMSTPGVAHGDSGTFSPAGNLGGTGTPGATPPNLVGLTSFNLHVVPEPSVIALGALGLGALLIRRRKQS